MKIKILAFLISMIFILTGCSPSTGARVQNDLEDRIVKLEALTEELERNIEARQQEINYAHARININDQHLHEFDSKCKILFHLIENIPHIERKQGYILDYQKENRTEYLIVDYAEFVPDDDSPNGFYIRNEVEERDKVKISEKIVLYIGEYVGSPEFPTVLELNDLIERIEEFKLGFYDFYFIEGELMLIMKRYIP